MLVLRSAYLVAAAVAVTLLAISGDVVADTPANCTYNDVKGLWVFHEGPRGNDKTINCSAKGTTTLYYQYSN